MERRRIDLRRQGAGRGLGGQQRRADGQSTSSILLRMAVDLERPAFVAGAGRPRRGARPRCRRCPTSPGFGAIDEFAIMGAAFHRAVHRRRPRVGLLNGLEDTWSTRCARGPPAPQQQGFVEASSRLCRRQRYLHRRRRRHRHGRLHRQCRLEDRRGDGAVTGSELREALQASLVRRSSAHAQAALSG